jgi:hypothetical protein
MDASQASHGNLMRFSALATRLEPGGEVVDAGDEVLFCDPHPFAFGSGALRGHSRPDGADLIERAEAWFGERGHDYVIHTRTGGEDASLEAAATAAGLVLVAERYPAMGAERPLAAPAVPGLEIRAVADADAAADFWTVCGASFPEIGFPPDIFEGPPTPAITHPLSTSFTGYLDDEPVASAMATVIDEVAFVGWVGTVPAARGRGAGGAVTAAATNAAFERGARLASLQSSPLGEAVYLRIGYRRLFDYRLWLSSRSRAAACSPRPRAAARSRTGPRAAP